MRGTPGGDTAPQLTIEVLDEPGAGGANHDYSIQALEQPHPDGLGTDDLELCRVRFQNGPINEHGINGITQESLLAVVIDRLRSFQNGPFPTWHNQVAIEHCSAALRILHQRTRERISRNVEGTNQA